MPSGAWADTVDRRHLLVLAAAVQGAGFASWTFFPAYPGFALGFVLWGVSGALVSGTFESLLYDDLAVRDRTDAYPRLIGWARSAQVLAVLAADGLAVPLIHLGGYRLLGLASVGMALPQLLLAATLPVGARARRSAEHHESGQYLRMLRAGLVEAATTPPVRRLLVVAAMIAGLSAYDEYFPLIAREHGVATATVPVLVALTSVGEVVGSALAGWTARAPARTTGLFVAAGGILVSLGALVPAYAGFVGIAVGYGLLANALINAEVRVQDAITGPARATVTSVLGFGEEIVALAIYATVGTGGTVGLSVSVTIALLGLPVLGIAVLAGRR